MVARQGGLGRGLGELFQNTAPVEVRVETGAEHAPEPGRSQPLGDGSWYQEVSVAAIRANPRQPREVFDEDALAELADSIQEVGLLEPIVVRQAGDDGFELIMGERRWRAHQRLGLETIPAIVRATDDDQLLTNALLENLHRTELNPLEEAAAYQQLMHDFGCTQDELSQRVKKSRSHIANTVRLLRLPASVQRLVAEGVLSAGHARALLALDDQDAQEYLAQRIVAEGLSVRATEELVTFDKLEARRAKPTPRGTAQNPRAEQVASSLADRFNTRVKVAIGKKRGRITIEFAGEDDLDRILGLFERQPANHHRGDLPGWADALLSQR